MLKLNVTEKVLVESDLAPTNSREVLQYVTPIEQIENLALEAFQNHLGEAWQKIQFLLFDMNLRLMESGFGLGTSHGKREWQLRHAIEQIECQYLPQEQVPSELSSAVVFMPWLKERISHPSQPHSR